MKAISKITGSILGTRPTQGFNPDKQHCWIELNKGQEFEARTSTYGEKEVPDAIGPLLLEIKYNDNWYYIPFWAKAFKTI